MTRTKNITKTRVRAEDIRPGDVVDLEGDRYADPNGEDVSFRHEHAIVSNVERETPECVRLDLADESYGFPVTHHLTRITRNS